MRRPLAAPGGLRIAPLGAFLLFVLLGFGFAGPRSIDTTGLNLVENGSFESRDFTPWTIGAWTGGTADACQGGGAMASPVITDESVYDGEVAARLGAPVAAFGHPAGASWIAQSIHLPRSYRAPELILHYRIVTNDIIHWASFRAEVHDLSGSRLQLLLRDGYDPANGAAIPGYDMGWQERRFDLSAYRGQTIQLYFEAKNEHCGGWGIWTYLDDVRVVDQSQVYVPIIMRDHRGIVPSVTPVPTLETTPTITPTTIATPTPTPSPTITPTASDTPTPIDTPTASDTPTPIDTPTPSDTPTPIDTPTPTPTPGWFVWPGPAAGDLADVAMSGDGTAWAVGAAGLILYFDGHDWVQWPGTSPTSENLTAVHVSSRLEAWAVTDGGSIIRFDGAEWRNIGPVTPAGEALWDIALLPDDEAGWAVGDEGTVVRFDGVNWFLTSRTLIPTARTLRAVYPVDAGVAWAVGDYGTILYYVNNRWTNWSDAMPGVQTSATLWDVQFPDGEEGWIVGDGGTFMKYINGAWYTLVPHPVGADVYSLELLAPDYGWAAGALGTLMSYTPRGWTQINPLTGAALLGIDLLTPDNGWAVGAAGVILRRGYASEVPTPTPTRRPPTPTFTTTPTSTATATVTLAPASTSTPSATPSSTPTSTSTRTATPTASSTPTATWTATSTGTSTPSPTPTSTTWVTSTPTRVPTTWATLMRTNLRFSHAHSVGETWIPRRPDGENYSPDCGNIHPRWFPWERVVNGTNNSW